MQRDLLLRPSLCTFVFNLAVTFLISTVIIDQLAQSVYTLWLALSLLLVLWPFSQYSIGLLSPRLTVT